METEVCWQTLGSKQRYTSLPWSTCITQAQYTWGIRIFFPKAPRMVQTNNRVSEWWCWPWRNLFDLQNQKDIHGGIMSNIFSTIEISLLILQDLKLTLQGKRADLCHRVPHGWGKRSHIHWAFGDEGLGEKSLRAGLKEVCRLICCFVIQPGKSYQVSALSTEWQTSQSQELYPGK